MLLLVKPLGVLIGATSFVMQITGGMVFGIALAETVSPLPVSGELAAAYAAIGALFGALMWAMKGRVERAEKREDKLLDADERKTDTIKELASATLKATEVTEKAVAAANAAVVQATAAATTAATAAEEAKRNGAKIDAISTTCTDIRQVVRDAANRRG
jgi:hypothetical protein